MAKKVYRVVACIGRKRHIIYETKSFDPADGATDYKLFQEAIREREKHCMKLWREGFGVTVGGRYHHIGKNIDGGKIEIFLYSAR